MSELKERFLAVYKETVTREGSDSLLDWLEHSDFFVAPASTRYHGCYEGGLLQHSLNVYDCLKIGIEAAGLQGTYMPIRSVFELRCLNGGCPEVNTSSIESGKSSPRVSRQSSI